MILTEAISSAGIALNVLSAGEHVPEIERHIRMLKERCRAVFNTLPFKSTRSRMIVEMEYCMNFWLHAFPADDRMSAHISPRELLTVMNVGAKEQCLTAIEAHWQTHEPMTMQWPAKRSVLLPSDPRVRRMAAINVLSR